MNDVSYLPAAAGKRALGARAAAAQAPPGRAAGAESPDDRPFSAVLKKARKKRTDEDELAQAQAVSGQARAASDQGPAIDDQRQRAERTEFAREQGAAAGGQQPISSAVEGPVLSTVEGPVVANQQPANGNNAVATGDQTAAVSGQAAASSSQQPVLSAAEGPAQSLAEGQAINLNQADAGEQAPATGGQPPVLSTVEGSAVSGQNLPASDGASEAHTQPAAGNQANAVGGQPPVLSEVEGPVLSTVEGSAVDDQPAESPSEKVQPAAKNPRPEAGQVEISYSTVHTIQGAENQPIEPARLAEAHSLEFIDQVSKSIQTLEKGGNTILRLQLHPENLGKIDLRLTSGADGLRVALTADLASTGALLERYLPELRQALSEAGLSLAGLAIGYGTPQDGSPQSDRWQAAQQSAAKQAAGSHPTFDQEEQAKRSTSRQRRISTTSVDYLI